MISSCPRLKSFWIWIDLSYRQPLGIVPVPFLDFDLMGDPWSLTQVPSLSRSSHLFTFDCFFSLGTLIFEVLGVYSSTFIESFQSLIYFWLFLFSWYFDLWDPWSLLKSLHRVVPVTYLFLTVSFLSVLWSYGRSVEFTQVPWLRHFSYWFIFNCSFFRPWFIFTGDLRLLLPLTLLGGGNDASPWTSPRPLRRLAAPSTLSVEQQSSRLLASNNNHPDS